MALGAEAARPPAPAGVAVGCGFAAAGVGGEATDAATGGGAAGAGFWPVVGFALAAVGVVTGFAAGIGRGVGVAAACAAREAATLAASACDGGTLGGGVEAGGELTVGWTAALGVVNGDEATGAGASAAAEGAMRDGRATTGVGAAGVGGIGGVAARGAGAGVGAVAGGAGGCGGAFALESAGATVGQGAPTLTGAGANPKTSTATCVINDAFTCGSRADAASVRAVAQRLLTVRMMPPEY